MLKYPKIQILTDKITNRTTYIFEIIFKCILKVDFVEVTDYKKIGKNCPLIVYTREENCFEGIKIPNDGLLYKSTIDEYKPKNLNFENNDIFSTSFYLITEFEKYRNIYVDIHQRYDSYKYQIFDKPIINIYADILKKLILQQFPTMVFPEQKFDYQITIDVDTAWKYLNKPFIISVLSVVKNILQLNFNELRNKILTYISKKDPLYTFDYIFENFTPQKTIFFFLINRSSKFDSRFTFRNKKLRKLIEQTLKRGYEIGIHPSYNSFDNEQLIKFEIKKLSEIINKDVNLSRQHFLRYKLPQTFNILDQNGIKKDFTICPIQKIGFQTAVATTYNWFNLKRNEKTNLKIQPIMIMDRTLQKYMNLAPQEALAASIKIINECKKVNGSFGILLHNNSFSDLDEWKGWKNIFSKIIIYLKK